MTSSCFEGENIHFELQTNCRVGKIRFYQFSCVIVHGFSLIQDFGCDLPKFITGVRSDLIDGISWFRGKNGCIFKIKQTLKQDNQYFT